MKRKKVVKLRGSKTHGYGSKKKHRGKGSRGGKGMAGTKKHRKFWAWKHRPGHLGKYGFKSLKKRNLKDGTISINLMDIEKLSDKAEVNVTEFGYDKVLGRGEITKPITLKAKSFSKKASEKIEKAKGKAVTL